MRLVWRQRIWSCPDPGCARRRFYEQVPTLVAPRAAITTRAVAWAVEQLRTPHANIQGLARRRQVAWKTLWRAIKPHLEARAHDEARFAGVSTLGVDEHVWHHTPNKTNVKGPPMFTGMVDLTRDQHGRVHARLLDLVPGRTGKAYATWLTERTPSFLLHHLRLLADDRRVAGRGAHSHRDGPGRDRDGPLVTRDPHRRAEVSLGRRVTSLRYGERLAEIGAIPSIGTVADSYDCEDEAVPVGL